MAYVGALTHSTKLLKISIDNGGHWGNDYYQNDMASHITGNKLVPITTGAQQKNAALSSFYAHPDLGRPIHFFQPLEMELDLAEYIRRISVDWF